VNLANVFTAKAISGRVPLDIHNNVQISSRYGYVPVIHVQDDIPNVSITFEKPEGRGVCIIRLRLQQFEEVTFTH
jgi:hypothetical protein